MAENIKKEPGTVEYIYDKIVDLCAENPEGVNEKILQNEMPNVDPKNRAKAINKLLSAGKIELFKNAQGLIYKGVTTKTQIKGDQEEKIVYGIIEEAGNKGTWIRDIRIKSNLVQTQLTKVLKALENKKVIKAVKSINAQKKKVYM